MSFLRRIYSAGGSEVNLREVLTRYTLSSISRIVMGDVYTGSITKIEELQELIDEWFFLGGAISLGDWIPWLAFLDLHGYVKRMKTYARKVDSFYSYVINNHKTKGNTGSTKKEDMVDALLKLADDPNLEVKLTNDSLKALIQVLKFPLHLN